jgi:hypothetical protein
MVQSSRGSGRKRYGCSYPIRRISPDVRRLDASRQGRAEADRLRASRGVMLKC